MSRRLFIVHNTVSGAVREETLDGKPYLVAPFVGVIEGVLNGELLQANAIAHFTGGWNGRPIVLNHPVNEFGAPISANVKSVIETLQFGQLLNCTFANNNSLAGELWVDLEKASRIGGDAVLCVERMQAGQPVEGSTAYWCDIEAKSGTFNGMKYNGVQHNLVPDHYALLPHDLGACSVAQGCGANPMKTNVACSCQEEKDELSTNDNQSLVRRIIRLLTRLTFHEPMQPTKSMAPHRPWMPMTNEQEDASGENLENETLPSVSSPETEITEETKEQQQGVTDMTQTEKLAAFVKANKLTDEQAAELNALLTVEVEKIVVNAKEETAAPVAALSADAQELLARQNAQAADVRAQYTKMLVDNQIQSAETCAKMSLGELANLAARLNAPVNYAGQGGPRTNTGEQRKEMAPPVKPMFEATGWVKNGVRINGAAETVRD